MCQLRVAFGFSPVRLAARAVGARRLVLEFDLYQKYLDGGGDWGGFLFLAALDQFFSRAGRCFQIFCCVALLRAVFIHLMQPSVWPLIIVQSSSEWRVTGRKMHSVRVMRSLDARLCFALGGGASLERNPRSGYRNRASNPRVGSGSASKLPTHSRRPRPGSAPVPGRRETTNYTLC